jgi:hypothetical protein
MSPQAAAGPTRSGLNLDAEIEAGIAGTRARNEADLLGMAAPRLDNNPVNPIYASSASRTPDEVRAAEAIASSPIEEVVVTAPKWSMGDDVIYRHATNSSYRDGFVQRAAVLSNALHVPQGYVKNTYDSAVAEFSNSNNSWFDRSVNLVGATAMFPLAMAEELGRGALNIPSAFFGAIPQADQAGGQFAVAFDPTQPADARVVGALGGVRDTAFAFTGLATPAAAFTGGVSAAPLSAEQRALQAFPGAEATAAARATYSAELGKTLGRYSAIEPGPLADDLAGTFAGGRYDVVELQQDTVLYRAGTADRPLGQFFSQEPPTSIVQTRVDKAVLPEWPGGGKSPLDTSFAVKIPQGTRVYVGEVGSQGGFYVGGTQQIVVVKPWSIRGVEVMESRPLR